MFKCEYEGNDIEIHFSFHSRKRMNERGINKEAIFGSVVSCLDNIMDMKSGEDFIIHDKINKSSTVASVMTDGDIVYIEIITVVDTIYAFEKVGQKVINLF